MSLARTLTGTFLAKAAGFAAAFLAGVILSRALGPSDRGSVDVIIMFTIMTAAFLPPLEDPQLYRIGRSAVPPREFLSSVLVLAVVLGLLGMGALDLLRTVAPEFFSYTDRVTGVRRYAPASQIRLAAIAVPCIIAFRLAVAYLQGHRAMKAFNLLQVAQQGLWLVLVVVLVVAAGRGVTGGIEAHVGAFAFAALAAWATAVRLPDVRPFGLRPSAAVTRTLLLDSSKLYLGAIAAWVILYGDKFILYRFHGTEPLAWYGLAVTLTGYARRFTQEPVKEVLGSRLPSLADDRAALAATMARASRHMVLLLGSVSLLLGAVAYPLIVLVYGRDFAPAYLPLLLILPGSVFWSVAVLLTYYFIGSRRFGFVTLVAAAMAAVNIGLNLLLVPRFHMIAAALVSTVGYGIHLGVLWMRVHRETGLPLRRLLVAERGDYQDLAFALRQLLGRFKRR